MAYEKSPPGDGDSSGVHAERARRSTRPGSGLPPAPTDRRQPAARRLMNCQGGERAVHVRQVMKGLQQSPQKLERQTYVRR